ncbi:unnamed protein product, partial [Ectocarpus sp. 12 AP-2014]
MRKRQRSRTCGVLACLLLLGPARATSSSRSRRAGAPTTPAAGFVVTATSGGAATGSRSQQQPSVRDVEGWGRRRTSARLRRGVPAMTVTTELQGETPAQQSRRETNQTCRLLEATGDYAFPPGEQLDEMTGLRKQTRVRDLQFKVAEPEVRYDPVRLEEQLFKQPVKWLVRNVELFVPLGTFVAKVLFDIQSGVELKNRKKRAGELLDIIGRLGPAIIKAGQALSSRPDLLPKEYLDELQKLQDRVPAFSNREAFAVVELELGVPFEDVYELVEPEPIAAASIGQATRLRVNGNLVAIKVQRPNCESTISLDLYVLRFYAGFLTKALKVLKREVDLTSIIDDFGELIYREIDYRAEMVNCQRFAELYANIPDVFVPKVGGKEGGRK